MKKLVVLVAVELCLIMGSCTKDQRPQQLVENQNRKVVIEGFSYNVEVVTIDSCEYILANGAERISIIHKQNCKNH